MSVFGEYIFSTTNIVVIGFIALFLYAGCSSVVVSTKNIDAKKLPKESEIPAFIPQDTMLGKAYASELKMRKGESGALLLDDGTQALLHRVALTRMAQKSIFLHRLVIDFYWSNGKI